MPYTDVLWAVHYSLILPFMGSYSLRCSHSSFIKSWKGKTNVVLPPWSQWCVRRANSAQDHFGFIHASEAGVGCAKGQCRPEQGQAQLWGTPI